MHITNDTLNQITYWSEIVEPFLDNPNVRSSEIFLNFQKVVGEKGDEESVDEAVFYAVCSICLLGYVARARRRGKDSDEAAQASAIEALKTQQLREELEEWKKKYAAANEIVSDRENTIEILRKGGHDHPEKEKPESSHTEDVHVQQLHVVNDLQQFYLPFSEYPSLNQSIGTSDIANDEHLKRVKQTMGIKENQEFSKMAFEFTISCGSRSTSDKDPYEGMIKVKGKTYDRSQIAYAIRTSGITVRQFCAAFANMYWNFNLARHTPPENWRKKGFAESTKFAAFDFFYAVGSNAAIPTEKNGSVKLIRPPTNEENEANMALRYTDIFESNAKNGGYVTANPHYDRGKAYESSGKAKLIEM